MFDWIDKLKEKNQVSEKNLFENRRSTVTIVALKEDEKVVRTYPYEKVLKGKLKWKTGAPVICHRKYNQRQHWHTIIRREDES